MQVTASDPFRTDAARLVPDGGRRPDPARRGRVGPSAAAEVAGLVVVVAAAAALVAPALAHGPYLGAYQTLLGAHHGLTSRAGATPRVWDNSDVADQMIPWLQVAWRQVHHGQLPLWNPYGGFGTPLAFNWQSAPFAVSSLVAYLAPLRLAFTVAVLTTLALAGSGAYLLGRVLGLGALASAAVGVGFELSGPFAAWLGYPFDSVNCWAGWIFAFGLLAVRRRSPWPVVALAAAVAAALYGGQPEGAVVLLGAAVVLLAVVAAAAVRGGGPGRARWRPALRLAGGLAAGVGLALPLVLPATEVSAVSIRRAAGGARGLPLHLLAYLGFQGYDGLPVTGTGGGGLSQLFYTETAAYVGVGLLALAGLAVVVRRRRPEVWGLAAAAVVLGALVFAGPLDMAVDRLPLVGSVDWSRALMPLALVLAALGGMGVDAVVRQPDRRRAARWLGAAFASAGMVEGALWLFDRGGLHGAALAARDASFRWPALSVAAGLLAAAGLWWAGQRSPGGGRWWAGRRSLAVGRWWAGRRRLTLGRGWAGRRSLAVGPGRSSSAGAEADMAGWLPRADAGPGPPWHRPAGPAAGTARARRLAAVADQAGLLAGAALVAVNTAFLVTAGAPLVQSSAHGFPMTAAIAAYQRAAGAGSVAFGTPWCQLGLAPDVNDAYRVHQLSIYDASLPKALFDAWPADTASPAGSAGLYLFCPAVTSVAVARQFGVRFVLEPASQPGPPGTVPAARLGAETLYRVPRSGPATLTPLAGGRLPPAGAVGRPLAVPSSDPAVWQVRFAASAPSVLRLHLDAAAGWHATIDGRPLALTRYAGMLLQARVPAGRHTVVLCYWPKAATWGLMAAGLSLAGLAGAVGVDLSRRRRRRRDARTTG